MYLLRNVQDAIPARMPRGRIAEFADGVRERLGVRPGAGVHEAFRRLGGTYTTVDTFGRYTDGIVIRARDDFACEDRHEVEHAALGLAECLGTLFLHYPLVVRRHGPDAILAVRRYPEGDDADRREAMAEAITFAVHFSLPAAAFREAFAKDPSPRALASAFHVDIGSAVRRMKSLGLATDETPDLSFCKPASAP
jgi:hypothetical protein